MHPSRSARLTWIPRQLGHSGVEGSGTGSGAGAAGSWFGARGFVESASSSDVELVEGGELVALGAEAADSAAGAASLE